jgi:hypothetical protein
VCWNFISFPLAIFTQYVTRVMTTVIFCCASLSRILNPMTSSLSLRSSQSGIILSERRVNETWRRKLYPLISRKEQGKKAASAFFFLYIIIILLIIRMIKAKFKIYEWQRATSSGAFASRHCQWHLCKRATASGVFGGC